jgi:hypothetical protein
MLYLAGMLESVQARDLEVTDEHAEPVLSRSFRLCDGLENREGTVMVDLGFHTSSQ